MRKLIFEQLKNAVGHVGFYYKNLLTGEVLGFHEDEQFEAASVIKLPVFAALCQGEASETVDMTEKLQVKHADKMPSCGALRFFTDEPMVDVDTLCRLMITISDNTATNILIKRFGIDQLNQKFLDLGLKETRIRRLLFDSAAAAQGKENVFIPREIGGLLERIFHRQLIYPVACEKIQETLLAQQINHKIPGKLPKKISVAHKTGEDTGISNDVGIVFSEEPFVIVFASNQTDVPKFEESIREISLLCYRKGGLNLVKRTSFCHFLSKNDYI